LRSRVGSSHTRIVLDDADRRAVPDRLDPRGAFRLALRAALVKAVDSRDDNTRNGCDYAPVRVGRCESHAEGRPSVGEAEG
jgi:hypothetical protein